MPDKEIFVEGWRNILYNNVILKRVSDTLPEDEKEKQDDEQQEDQDDEQQNKQDEDQKSRMMNSKRKI